MNSLAESAQKDRRILKILCHDFYQLINTIVQKYAVK